MRLKNLAALLLTNAWASATVKWEGGENERRGCRAANLRLGILLEGCDDVVGRTSQPRTRGESRNWGLK